MSFEDEAEAARSKIDRPIEMVRALLRVLHDGRVSVEDALVALNEALRAIAGLNERADVPP